MSGNTFSTYTSRVAAKPHQCQECGTTIKPGTTYFDLKWVYDGRWWQERICAPCGKLRERAADEQPFVSEMHEFVNGYHHPEQIAADPLLSGFIERYEESQ